MGLRIARGPLSLALLTTGTLVVGSAGASVSDPVAERRDAVRTQETRYCVDRKHAGFTRERVCRTRARWIADYGIDPAADLATSVSGSGRTLSASGQADSTRTSSLPRQSSDFAE